MNTNRVKRLKAVELMVCEPADAVAGSRHIALVSHSGKNLSRST